MNLNNEAISMGDWIEEGCKPGVWFYIIRHEILDKFNRHTLNMLMSLIEFTLNQYGKYEVKEPQFINKDEIFMLEKNYAMFKTLGNVNGVTTQVVAMYAEARIIDESE